jgi:hypothetical protein
VAKAGELRGKKMGRKRGVEKKKEMKLRGGE